MEYQDLVRQIIEAERGAQELARETRERQAGEEASMREEAAAIREAAMERARAKVDAASREINAAAEADLQRWDQRLAAAMARVESSDRKYRQNWVETLFRRIVEDAP